MKKSISVQGTVEKWVWANPHCWLYVAIDKGDGTREIWGFEGGSTGMLGRTGWNAADMKPGDKVTIVNASPSRDGSHVALLHEVQLANGRVLRDGAGTPPPGAGAPPAGAANPPSAR